MPAYNAARTLVRTYRDIPKDVVDDVILVDDASQDDTVEIARLLNSGSFGTTRIWAMAAIRKRATGPRWKAARTLS